MASVPAYADAAKSYVNAGLSVIPIKPRSKEALINWRPYQSRLPSMDQVETWWDQWPGAGVAIICGRVSGVVVLDVDIEQELGPDFPIPPTPMVTTGSGGRHYYFRAPADLSRIPTANLRSHCNLEGEIRGDGAYVLAPPSIHPNGERYSWEIPIDEVDLAEPPDWILKLIRRNSKVSSSPQPEQAGASIDIDQLPISPKWREIIRTGAVPAEYRNTDGGPDRSRRDGAVIGTLLRAGVDEANIKTIFHKFPVGEKVAEHPNGNAYIDHTIAQVRQFIGANGGSGNESKSWGRDSLPEGRATATAESEQEVTDFSLTDAGNAELLIHLHGHELRYDHPRERWLLWNGTRWRPDADGHVPRLTLEAARHRLRLASEIEDKDRRKAVVKWATKSENIARQRAALDWAKSLKPIADDGEGWDSDPWLLGVPNGVTDLRTGQLIEAKPEQQITKQAMARHDHDADCPRFKNFLEQIFQKDAELIDFVHRAVGYSLTGSTREQVLFICYGTGANGKSTLLNILRYVLGDYAANTPFSTFEDLQSQSSTNDVAALVGKRLVTSSETRERTRLNEARVKALTGGDPITARFLYREYFTFTPQFKTWLAVNHKPRVSDDSVGFWRRVRLIPFDAQFSGDDADPNLYEKLQLEAEGILNWAIQGCALWQSHGLEPPDSISHATAAYREEQDVFGQFISDCCVEGPELWADFGDLYEAYSRWAEENGLRAMPKSPFGIKLSERGYSKGRTSTTRYYKGIGLRVPIAHEESQKESGE